MCLFRSLPHKPSADVCCCVQVLVGELMTDADMRADAVISPALQNVLLMLSASEAQGLPAGADLLQHLVPSQKHLTMLHRHVQVYAMFNGDRGLH